MTDGESPFLDPDHGLTVRRVESVKNMTRAKLDELPFGVIEVDLEGVILAYNRAEGELAQLSPPGVLGKNFFTEVAPCTNVKEFAGKFREQRDASAPYVIFPYQFEFAHGTAHVTVLLHVDHERQRGWIFVQENARHA